MTEDIIQLVSWLKETDCEMVAMESTGSYWKPVYNIFEEWCITIMVVNAQYIKGIPGRKTDVKAAEWIADLVRHGLVASLKCSPSSKASVLMMRQFLLHAYVAIHWLCMEPYFVAFCHSTPLLSVSLHLYHTTQLEIAQWFFKLRRKIGQCELS